MRHLTEHGTGATDPVGITCWRWTARLDGGQPTGRPGRPGKRGQAPFAGTARRVLRTNGSCPLFPGLQAGLHRRSNNEESQGRNSLPVDRGSDLAPQASCLLSEQFQNLLRIELVAGQVRGNGYEQA